MDDTVSFCDWDYLGQSLRLAIRSDGLYLSQLCMSKLFGLSVKTINEHLLLKGLSAHAVNISTHQQEGRRSVRRSVLHYSLDHVRAIATATGKISGINALLEFARSRGVFVGNSLVAIRPEYSFGDLLAGILSGVTEIRPQFRVRNWRVDFYLPALKLIVEYDEPWHKCRVQRDLSRQSQIEKILGAEFLRVTPGDEVVAMNQIVRRLAG